jgi:hypothetical protein
MLLLGAFLTLLLGTLEGTAFPIPSGQQTPSSQPTTCWSLIADASVVVDAIPLTMLIGNGWTTEEPQRIEPKVKTVLANGMTQHQNTGASSFGLQH